MVGDAPCGFVPIDWLKDDVEASSDPVVSGITLTVEVRYFPSGRMPWALLGARFDPSPGRVVEFEVGHTGQSPMGSAPSCQGPLGRPLVPALPLEVARGAMAGLIGCNEPLPPGRLTVVAGGYDEVDSSFYIFERAAYLLRLLLPAALSRDGVTKEVFDAALQQCVDSGRY